MNMNMKMFYKNIIMDCEKYNSFREQSQEISSQFNNFSPQITNIIR